MTRTKRLGGLDFPDLEAHNDALLAKLGWRLLQFPNALASKVLLGKYCHSKPFMDCSAMSTCSHGWRGILAGREVLRHGLGWLVGDGSRIRLWHDPWLSVNSPAGVTGPSTYLTKDWRVSEIINADGRSWNWDCIDAHVPHIRKEVEMLSLTSSNRIDKLVWLHKKNGRYSAKSGYELLLSAKQSVSQTEFDWNRHIWKIKTTPKIKMLLWKCMANALPLSEQLRSRNIVEDLRCLRCGHRETEDHVFVQCPYAQRVCELAPCSIPTFASLPTISLLLQSGDRIHNLPPSGITSALHAWLVWYLWKGRNLLVFSNQDTTQEEIVLMAQREAKAWQDAQDQLAKSKSPSRHHADEANVLAGPCCYVDAAWNSSLQVSGAGWLYRSDTGSLIGEYTDTSTNITSAIMVEAWAVKRAMENAVSRGLATLHLFSDSQLLVNMLNRGDTHTEFHWVICDIRELCSSFSLISFSFIPRSNNSLADCLAKMALTTFCTSFFEG